MRTRAQRHRPRARGDAVTRTVLTASVALTLFVTAGFLFGVTTGGRSTVRASDAGTVQALYVLVGDQVDADRLLAVVTA